MMIARRDSIINYGYIQKMSGRKNYIGLCFSFNGVMCTDIHALKKLCEEAITQWVVNGEILEFADNGNIISKVDELYKTASEFNKLSDILRLQIDASNLKFEVLPPINYAISDNAEKVFTFNNHDSTIRKALNDYNYIYIYGDSTSKTLASYADKLYRLNAENEHLKAENAKINRQKKRTMFVGVLSVIITIGVIIFYFYAQSKNLEINNLGIQREQLQAKNFKLEKYNNLLRRDSIILQHNLDMAASKIAIMKEDSANFEQKIDSCINECEQLETDLSIARVQKTKAENELRAAKKDLKDVNNIKVEHKTLLNSIKEESPLIIYDIEFANKYYNGSIETNYGGKIYSNSSYYLAVRIKYRGVRSGTQTMTVKIYNPNGVLCRNSSSPYGCTYSQNMYVTAGNSSQDFIPWNGNNGYYDANDYWKTGEYKFEIWCGGSLIATKFLTIY